MTEINETTDTPAEANPNREAARYRTRLREVEAERDRLAEQLKTMRKAAAEHVLADILTKPSAFWMAGNDVNEFYDEEGRLDTDRLRETAEAAANEHGLARVVKIPDLRQGARYSDPAPRTAGWADVFKAAS